jgi:putative oxidoreductase
MNQNPSKGLNIGLWVAQVLLALAFGMAGAMKAMTPLEELAKSLPWVTDLPRLVRFIGVAEFSGALGMILPSALRIKPVLTPLAGAGLVVIMCLAVLFHLSRGEAAVTPVNLVLGALAAFVAWGRYTRAPIAPRS